MTSIIDRISSSFNAPVSDTQLRGSGIGDPHPSASRVTINDIYKFDLQLLPTRVRTIRTIMHAVRTRCSFSRMSE